MNESGLDPNIVGKIYEGKIVTVDPGKTIAYAKATNEINPQYYESDENKLRIPPLFPVTMLIDPMMQIVTDETLNLDILRMVHGEQEILYLRPLRPREKIKTKIKLDSVDVKETGDVLWAKMTGYAKEEIIFEMRAGLFFKKATKKIETSKPIIKEDSLKKQILVRQTMKVTPDQSVRYAEASGDENPIHVDKDIARAAGLPDKILHGLCTLAFATQAIVDNLAAGDPTKVKRIKTRFSKPVFMEDILTTEGWLLEENETNMIIGFETKNENGEAVLKFGVIELVK